MPRNVNGEYELPAGNPVVSGTIISTNWANDTMADLATALTNSLSRNGNGGMLAPFLNADGSEAAPGIAWSNEPSTGFWRAGPQDMRASVSALATQRWNEQGSQLWRNGQWEEILTNSGGSGGTTINNLVVTGSFTSPGIDDNATSTAITIDANENVGIGTIPSSWLTSVAALDVGASAASYYSGGITHNAYFDNTDGRWEYKGTGPATFYNVQGGTHVWSYAASGTANNPIAFNEAMRIDADGNVGIGTESPIARLEVNDTSGDDNGLYVFKSGRSSAKNYSSSDMSASSTCWLQAQENNTSLANTLVMRQYDAGTAISALYNTTSSSSLAFGTSNGTSAIVERMRIDASGNVGIGTDTPGRLLTVSDTGAAIISLQSTSSDNCQIFFGDAASEKAGKVLYNHNTGAMSFEVEDAERMRIDASGKVGIGTSDPDQALVVNGQIALSYDGTNSYQGIKRSGVGTVYYASTTSDASTAIHTFTGSSDAVKMTILEGGSVLVGVSSSMAQGGGGPLQVYSAGGSQLILAKGTGAPSISFGSATTQYGLMEGLSGGGFNWYTGNGTLAIRLSLDNSGNLTATGNVTAYSDERLKDNIETLDGSKVYDMRGVSFTKDGEAGSGVIAQELQMVAPELVHEGGEYLSVAYGNLVGYLIEAVKDLKAEVEELKRAR